MHYTMCFRDYIRNVCLRLNIMPMMATSVLRRTTIIPSHLGLNSNMRLSNTPMSAKRSY